MLRDARFQDPERFPCAVEYCKQRAAGWVSPELVPHGFVVRGEGPRVYMCQQHGPEWWEKRTQPRQS